MFTDLRKRMLLVILCFMISGMGLYKQEKDGAKRQREERLGRIAEGFGEKVWNLDAEGTRNKLEEVLLVEGWLCARVRHRHGEVFLTVTAEGKKETGVEKTLRILGFRCWKVMEAEIHFHGETIGKMEAENWEGCSGRHVLAGTLPLLLASVTCLILQLQEKNRALETALGKIRENQERIKSGEKLRAIGQVAGGVAHDFNNQLVVIQGFAELLLEDAPTTRSRDYTERIIRGCRRAAGLIRQLLVFGHKGPRTAIPVDLHWVIREVEMQIRPRLGPALRCESELKAARPSVTGDPALLQNALLNLALNARDALAKGGLLRFSTREIVMDAETIAKHQAQGDPGVWIELTVVDTGHGMSDEVKSRLFEPFYTTKPEGRGTGLGLSSVLTTVHEHRGFITIESELGRGTRCALFLPQAPQREQPGTEVFRRQAKNRKARILVIDDEDDIRDYLTLQLSHWGHEVIASGDGEEALRHFSDAAKRFDLILLDMIMPRMNGREIFHRIRERDPEAKILLVSGFSISGETEDLIEHGAVGFLQKPVEAADLAARLAELLETEKAPS